MCVSPFRVVRQSANSELIFLSDFIGWIYPASPHHADHPPDSKSRSNHPASILCRSVVSYSCIVSIRWRYIRSGLSCLVANSAFENALSQPPTKNYFDRRVRTAKTTADASRRPDKSQTILVTGVVQERW